MATTHETSAGCLIRLGRADDVGEGQSRGFDPHDEGWDTIFVVRCKGVLLGWRNACPHVGGGPMAWRKDAYMNAVGTRIVCHAHGAEFMPDSGLCVQGPCIGARLTPVPVVVDGGGDLLARMRASQQQERP